MEIKPNFRITIKYDEDLDQEELHYEKDLEENYVDHIIFEQNFVFSY